MIVSYLILINTAKLLQSIQVNNNANMSSKAKNNNTINKIIIYLKVIMYLLLVESILLLIN